MDLPFTCLYQELASGIPDYDSLFDLPVEASLVEPFFCYLQTSTCNPLSVSPDISKFYLKSLEPCQTPSTCETLLQLFLSHSSPLPSGSSPNTLSSSYSDLHGFLQLLSGMFPSTASIITTEELGNISATVHRNCSESCLPLCAQLARLSQYSQAQSLHTLPIGVLLALLVLERVYVALALLRRPSGYRGYRTRPAASVHSPLRLPSPASAPTHTLVARHNIPSTHAEHALRPPSRSSLFKCLRTLLGPALAPAVAALLAPVSTTTSDATPDAATLLLMTRRSELLAVALLRRLTLAPNPASRTPWGYVRPPAHSTDTPATTQEHVAPPNGSLLARLALSSVQLPRTQADMFAHATRNAAAAPGDPRLPLPVGKRVLLRLALVQPPLVTTQSSSAMPASTITGTGVDMSADTGISWGSPQPSQRHLRHAGIVPPAKTSTSSYASAVEQASTSTLPFTYARTRPTTPTVTSPILPSRSRARPSTHPHTHPHAHPHAHAPSSQSLSTHASSHALPPGFFAAPADPHAPLLPPLHLNCSRTDSFNAQTCPSTFCPAPPTAALPTFSSRHAPFPFPAQTGPLPSPLPIAGPALLLSLTLHADLTCAIEAQAQVRTCATTDPPVTTSSARQSAHIASTSHALQASLVSSSPDSQCGQRGRGEHDPRVWHGWWAPVLAQQDSQSTGGLAPPLPTGAVLLWLPLHGHLFTCHVRRHDSTVYLAGTAQTVPLAVLGSVVECKDTDTCVAGTGACSQGLVRAVNAVRVADVSAYGESSPHAESVSTLHKNTAASSLSPSPSPPPSSGSSSVFNPSPTAFLPIYTSTSLLPSSSTGSQSTPSPHTAVSTLPAVRGASGPQTLTPAIQPLSHLATSTSTSVLGGAGGSGSHNSLCSPAPDANTATPYSTPHTALSPHRRYSTHSPAPHSPSLLPPVLPSLSPQECGLFTPIRGQAARRRHTAASAAGMSTDMSTGASTSMSAGAMPGADSPISAGGVFASSPVRSPFATSLSTTAMDTATGATTHMFAHNDNRSAHRSERHAERHNERFWHLQRTVQHDAADTESTYTRNPAGSASTQIGRAATMDEEELPEALRARLAQLRGTHLYGALDSGDAVPEDALVAEYHRHQQRSHQRQRERLQERSMQGLKQHGTGNGGTDGVAVGVGGVFDMVEDGGVTEEEEEQEVDVEAREGGFHRGHRGHRRRGSVDEADGNGDVDSNLGGSGGTRPYKGPTRNTIGSPENLSGAGPSRQHGHHPSARPSSLIHTQARNHTHSHTRVEVVSRRTSGQPYAPYTLAMSIETEDDHEDTDNLRGSIRAPFSALDTDDDSDMSGSFAQTSDAVRALPYLRGGTCTSTEEGSLAGPHTLGGTFSPRLVAKHLAHLRRTGSPRSLRVSHHTHTHSLAGPVLDAVETSDLRSGTDVRVISVAPDSTEEQSLLSRTTLLQAARADPDSVLKARTDADESAIRSTLAALYRRAAPTAPVQQTKTKPGPAPTAHAQTHARRRASGSRMPETAAAGAGGTTTGANGIGPAAGAGTRSARKRRGDKPEDVVVAPPEGEVEPPREAVQPALFDMLRLPLEFSVGLSGTDADVRALARYLTAQWPALVGLLSGLRRAFALALLEVAASTGPAAAQQLRAACAAALDPIPPPLRASLSVPLTPSMGPPASPRPGHVLSSPRGAPPGVLRESSTDARHTPRFANAANSAGTTSTATVSTDIDSTSGTPPNILAALLADPLGYLAHAPALPLAALGRALFHVSHEGVAARQIKLRAVYALDSVLQAHEARAAETPEGSPSPLVACADAETVHPKCRGCVPWTVFSLRTVTQLLLRLPGPVDADAQLVELAVPRAPADKASEAREREDRPSLLGRRKITADVPADTPTAPPATPAAAPHPALPQTARYQSYVLMWRGATALRLAFEELDGKNTQLVPAFAAHQLALGLLHARGVDATQMQTRIRALVSAHGSVDQLMVMSSFLQLMLLFLEQEVDMVSIARAAIAEFVGDRPTGILPLPLPSSGASATFAPPQPLPLSTRSTPRPAVPSPAAPAASPSARGRHFTFQ